MRPTQPCCGLPLDVEMEEIVDERGGFRGNFLGAVSR